MSVLRDDGTRCSAALSPDRTYRYSLTRIWDQDKPFIRFVGLNPSTADEHIDDPTVRRCVGFARDWGAGGIVMLNVFAFRATDPRVMKRADDPIGPRNDWAIRLWTLDLSDAPVVACWGVHGDHQLRGRRVEHMLKQICPDRLRIFGLTKDGHPKHPLYLSRLARLERWDRR